jgi:hypothetical protein
MAEIAERQGDLVSPNLRALSDLAAAVAQRSDEIEEFLGRICATLARSFGFERVVMHRYYEATNEIAPLVAHGRDHFARDYAYPIEEEPLVKRALDAGRPIYVRDVRAGGGALRGGARGLRAELGRLGAPARRGPLPRLS